MAVVVMAARFESLLELARINAVLLQNAVDRGGELGALGARG